MIISTIIDLIVPFYPTNLSDQLIYPITFDQLIHYIILFYPNQSINQLINPSIQSTIHSLIHSSIHQPFIHSFNPSIHQSTNQPTNHPPSSSRCVVLPPTVSTIAEGAKSALGVHTAAAGDIDPELAEVRGIVSLCCVLLWLFVNANSFFPHLLSFLVFFFFSSFLLFFFSSFFLLDYYRLLFFPPLFFCFPLEKLKHSLDFSPSSQHRLCVSRASKLDWLTKATPIKRQQMKMMNCNVQLQCR